MKQKKNASLEKLIREHYQELPASERKLADVVLAFPGELTAYSAQELAQLAEVSNAAVSRFFKRLGFKNYLEARRLVRDSKEWGSPLYLQSKNLVASKVEKNFQQFREEELTNLGETLDQLDLEEVEEICKAIPKAGKLWLVGFRNSHFIAGFARWQFIQYRPGVHILPVAGETLGEYLAEMKPNDLVIVVGVRRRVKGLKSLMKRIQALDVPILYLTDFSADKHHAYAKWVINCHVAGQFLFDSYTSIMSVIRFLAVTAYHKAGVKGQQYLKKIEQEHEQLAEFDE